MLKNIFSSFWGWFWTVMFGGTLLMVFSSLFTGILVSIVWNWLVPSIFGLTTISWLQGWGLTFLIGLLTTTNAKVEVDD